MLIQLWKKGRLALLQDSFSVTNKPGVPGVGKVPPPARTGRLQALSQAKTLQIEGAIAAVTSQRPAPAPTPVPSEPARRNAKLQAELDKKEKKNQRKGVAVSA